MPGYWNKPEATAETVHDGWLHTGDIGYLDDDGYLFITDRAKDMIIRGGENVYCVEIENRLVEHPAIADAAVIGVPHPTLGEEVKAVVRLEPSESLDAAAVQAWVGETLAAFKVPAYVEIVTETSSCRATRRASCSRTCSAARARSASPRRCSSSPSIFGLHPLHGRDGRRWFDARVPRHSASRSPSCCRDLVPTRGSSTIWASPQPAHAPARARGGKPTPPRGWPRRSARRVGRFRGHARAHTCAARSPRRPRRHLGG